MICPQCRSEDCFRSHRKGLRDFFFTILGSRPWRCHTCDHRFYARRVATSFACYVHCSKCGNLDLERIARNRVDEDPLAFLKRRFGFPAYRCDPCRHRFFSLRPFRRIIPSMASTGERIVHDSQPGHPSQNPASDGNSLSPAGEPSRPIPQAPVARGE